MLIVRRPKLYYRTSGIIIPEGGPPVHLRTGRHSCQTWLMSYFALPWFRSSAPFLRRVRELFPKLGAPPYIVSATAPLEVPVGRIPGRRGTRAVKQRTGRTRSRYCVRHCCRTQSINVGLFSGACGRAAQHYIR